MNKHVLITGGTRGIGRALVEKFAEQGFSIITCSRNQEALNELRDDLTGRFPSCAVMIFKADLSVKDEAKAFTDFVNTEVKSIDVLINNTGFYIPGQIHSEDDGVLDRMLGANLYSAYHVTRGIVPGMMSAKRGHIFNICSIASKVAYVNGGSYCISKFAVYGMTKVLREEMKPYGIKVTAVLPGAVLTSSWEDTELPPERFIQPDDVAESVFSAYSLSKGATVEEVVIRPQEGDI